MRIYERAYPMLSYQNVAGCGGGGGCNEALDDSLIGAFEYVYLRVFRTFACMHHC